MKSDNATQKSNDKARIRPGLTPESREGRMISLAFDVAERQLKEGTASSQVITHFLKLGTELSRLEREKIRQETRLIEAKQAAVAATDDIKQICEDAIAAMKSYQGNNEY